MDRGIVLFVEPDVRPDKDELVNVHVEREISRRSLMGAASFNARLSSIHCAVVVLR